MAERILEVCKVTPLQGSPTNMSLPLTFFDLLWLKIPPPELLFFYEVSYSESFFSESIFPRLKHSLSITLQHFLPLSGHLAWPFSSHNPVLSYKEGDGVLLTVAVSCADFHHLSGKGLRQCKIFRPLVAPLVGSDSHVSVLAVKITLFPNKGFCICITLHHGVFDAKSVALFMNLWASISKFGEVEGLRSELIPNFERKIIRERYAEIESSYIDFLKKNRIAQNSLAIEIFDPPADKLRGRFELSDVELRKLKGQVGDQVSYVSTLTITYAYITLCMVKTKELANNSVGFLLAMDIRSRLEPPLPANYFGNCLGYFTGILDKEKLLRDGLAVIVNCISKTRKDLEDNEDDGVLKWVPLTFILTNEDVSAITLVTVASSSRLGFQHTDFGWGRPKKMDITLVDTTPCITVTDLEDGGVEVELSLDKCEMERFSYEFSQGLNKITKRRSLL